MKYKVDLDILEAQINLCDRMCDEIDDENDADLFDGLANFLSLILYNLENDKPLAFDGAKENKAVCAICGKTHFDMSIDKPLKEKFGIEASVCLDCSAWLADYERYDIMLENGIINDEMFHELVTEK